MRPSNIKHLPPTRCCSILGLRANLLSKRHVCIPIESIHLERSPLFFSFFFSGRLGPPLIHLPTCSCEGRQAGSPPERPAANDGLPLTATASFDDSACRRQRSVGGFLARLAAYVETQPPPSSTPPQQRRKPPSVPGGATISLKAPFSVGEDEDGRRPGKQQACDSASISRHHRRCQVPALKNETEKSLPSMKRQHEAKLQQRQRRRKKNRL